VDILIDDRPVAERIDCYGEQLAPGLKIDLANLKLSPGEHRLMIRSTGKSEKSKGYWAGLDYIQLQSDIYR
jgi:hypothetical protein